MSKLTAKIAIFINQHIPMTKFLTFILLAAISLTAQVQAAPASGQFIATKPCPLYQSKNKRTNPGNEQTAAGQQYRIREMLGKPNQPQWLRIDTQANQSPLRWVAADCGTVNGLSHNKADTGSKTSASSCSTKGKQDSYILALSWQSAFCELGGRHKAECQALRKHPQMPAGNSFTLHGLWPNQRSCGSQYGYCGQVKHKTGGFCDYPALDLRGDVRSQLDEVMPSAKFGTCLQRHEYWKHGTCMSDNPAQYFAQAITLTQQVNQSAFVSEFIHEHKGRKVTRDEWNRAFDASFGSGAHRKVKLQCKRGMLTEIQLQLPASLTGTLPALLQQADKAHKGSCANKFRLED
ncbi:ribonuclease T(2) [Shewanella sp. NFH-SH190041]|uniref:ribonuclease T2 family protein n=1 Tax=Shewanella sp. NFH-SH190041 TaxID=2950245 RepID=UPI0021C3DF31|nr:ribonuclease T [Shewanella sp. NFH-SH190041]BDM62884.1 ribonuclease T(2) [Shewanella sp. NFH-SH190041]